MNASPSRRDWDARELLRAALLRNAEQASYMATALALTPVLYRALGAEDYGVWLLLISQAPLLRLLDPGLKLLLLREVVAARARGDIGAARATVANAFMLALGICVGACALALPAGGWLLDALGATKPGGQAALLLAPLALFCCALLADVADAILCGANRFGVSNLIGVATTLAGGLLVGLLAMLGYGLLSVALATAGAPCVALALKHLAVRRLVPELSPTVSACRLNRAAWRPILGFAPWSLLTGAAWLASYNVDNLIVGALLSFNALGAYGVAQRLPNALRGVAHASLWAVVPFGAELRQRDEAERLRSSMLRMTNAATIAAVCVVIGLWSTGPLLLADVAGRVTMGAWLLRLGLIATLIFSLRLVPENVLWSAGRQRRVAVIYAAGSAGNVALSVVLTLRFGLPGPVLGTIMAGVGMLAATMWSATKEAGLLARGMLRAIALPLTLGVPTLLAVDGAGRVAGHALTAQSGFALLGVVVYLAGVYGVVLTVEDRRLARALVGGLRARQTAPA